MREFQVEVIDGHDVTGAWLALDTRPPKQVIFCEFELAEEVVGFVEYTDGWFRVGVGESLRPYDEKYFGTDKDSARAAWWALVQHHAELGE